MTFDNCALAVRRWLPVSATLGVAAMVAVSAPIGSAFAQEEEQQAQVQPRFMDTLTVSARKRDESFIDVPVAMQVFNSEALERYGVSDLTELADLAAAVQLFPASSGSGANFSVRGIGSTTLDPGVSTSVAINIDGMSINRGRIVRQAMFDMESVEVLKGPQALFFGKNSPAGVVTIKSRGPSDEWEFGASVFYEFDADEFIGEASVSGPISEKVGMRLAYQGSTAKGWVKNVAQPQPIQPGLVLEPYTFPGALDTRLGGYDQHIARLTLQFDPTDEFSATLKVLGSTMNNDGTGSLNEVISCSGPLPITAGLVDPDGDCARDGVVSSGALPTEVYQNYQGLENRPNGSGFASYDSLLVTLTMDYQTDDFVLTSVTGVHYYDWFRFDNFDSTVYWQLGGLQDEQQTTISQEIRFLSTFDSPINFMIGAFYENLDRDSDNQGKIAAVGPDPITGNTNNWAGISTVKGDSVSVFAQLIWDITDDLELTGGARYTYEDKTASTGLTYVHPFLAGIFLTPGVLIEPDFSDNNISPEATITWSVADGISIYAAYKTGYKSGGFSTQTIIGPNDTPEGLTYQAEKAEGGEIGLKSELLDRRLRLNFTAFLYDFDGIQDSVFNAATTNFAIINADSRSKGFEIDGSLVATDNLILRGQVAYTSAKYRSFPNAPCFGGQTLAEGCVPNTTGLGGPGMVQDISGRTRPNAPKWSGSVGFSYDTAVANAMMIGISSDLVFTSGYITQVADSPGSFQDSYVQWNASVRLYSDDESWEVAFIGRNLTNELYCSGTADKPGGTRNQVTGFGDINCNALRGRQLGIQAKFRY
ncbi:MAG: TonB-dependent receptor [Alphaproteobacteria bacterium]